MSAQGLARDPEGRTLELVRIGNDPADVHVAGSGNVGQPRAHEAPGAGLRGREPQARSPRVVEDELGHATLVVDREELGAEGAAKRPLEPLGSGRGARGHDEVDRDLQIAGADRDLNAALLFPSLGEHPRDGRLARPEQAKQSSCRRTSPSENPLHRVVLDDAPPEPTQLPRGPRERDGDPPIVFEEDRRRRAGEAESDASGGKRSLLANAGLKVGVRPAQPFGDRAGDGLDLGSQALVDD